MADTMNVSIRMDRELKAQADALFTDLGLTMSTAVTVFIRQCLRRGKLPFELESDMFYSDANLAWVRASLTDARAGVGLIPKTLDELEDMAGD